MKTKIGLIGDYRPDVRAHLAIPKAVDLVARQRNSEIETTWLATDTLVANGGHQLLLSVDALWCVPGSPYASMDGALSAIRFAREYQRPFLGTCGGFQHALIEYARNVLGMFKADHIESNPSTTLPLIASLSCSLTGTRGTVKLKKGSRINIIYGANEIVEEYHCGYGFNAQFRSVLEGGALQVTGEDSNGEVRIVELREHPFFFATLFQPELSALEGKAHSLVHAFLQATLEEDCVTKLS